jgi:hypothetical protein
MRKEVVSACGPHEHNAVVLVVVQAKLFVALAVDEIVLDSHVALAVARLVCYLTAAREGHLRGQCLMPAHQSCTSWASSQVCLYMNMRVINI